MPRHDPINPPPPTRDELPYMGGTAFGCGDHPTAHKRHRWGPWQTWKLGNGRLRHDRMCLNCALVSDAKYSQERKDKYLTKAPLIDRVNGRRSAFASHEPDCFDAKLLAEVAVTIEALVEALQDCRAGLEYVRANHGELYGVGFERCFALADASIAKAQS